MFILFFFIKFVGAAHNTDANKNILRVEINAKSDLMVSWNAKPKLFIKLDFCLRNLITLVKIACGIEFQKLFFVEFKDS